MSTASILALLRSVRTANDARVAAMQVRLELRRYATKVDVAADLRDDAESR
jgi:hypothetical protein